MRLSYDTITEVFQKTEKTRSKMSENRALIEYLKTRRSVTLPFLQEPGPDRQQLQDILEIGTRVPDHGKLAPWRLITIEGEARNIAGQKLADLVQSRDPEVSEEILDAERTRFVPAPITIGVISAAHDHPKIPIIEQQFSAACVCFNLVHAAHALGFAAHWVTRWYAFDAEASAIFGAKEGEFFAGFVHIGTPTTHLGERPRPELADVVESWVG